MLLVRPVACCSGLLKGRGAVEHCSQHRVGLLYQPEVQQQQHALPGEKGPRMAHDSRSGNSRGRWRCRMVYAVFEGWRGTIACA